MRLAVRARSALDEQLTTCREFLQGRLAAVVSSTSEQLFKQANQSRNNTEQQDCLSSVATLRQQGADISDRFLALLPGRLGTFGQAVEAARKIPDEGLGLSLVTDTSYDETVMLKDLCGRAQARTTMQLFELGHRYAVLAALPVLPSDEQPFGPSTLCAFMRQATDELDVPGEHKIALFKQFDRLVLQDVQSLYGKLNETLAERGILPELRSFASQQRGEKPAHAFHEPAARDVADDQLQEEEDRSDDVEETARSVSSQDETSTQTQDQQVLFESLKFLLRNRRQQQGTAMPAARRQLPQREDVDRVLGDLQREMAVRQSAGGDELPEPQSMQHLRRDMLAGLRKLDPEGASPYFGPEQLDTIELSSMLFERLSQDVESTAGSALIGELQAPLLRVALNDASFFSDRKHPARTWLEQVAEASARWAPDADPGNGDPLLIKRIHGMNRTINRDFDGDLSIFKGMAEDLDRQIKQLAHRATVTERRFVEASRGREKLELARTQAGTLVDECIGTSSLPRLTRAMLRHAWTDVLALTLLRHGEDSDEFRETMLVTEALGNGGTDYLPDPDCDLGCKIRQGLSQVGLEPNEADLLAREVTGEASDEDDNDDDRLTRTELALKLKQRKPIGTAQIDKISEAVEKPANDSSHDEAALQTAIERIKSMPFGTWFVFDEDDFDEPVHRKMSWYSPHTGRCLFVNRRGVRTHDTSIEHLARAMLAGTARLAPTHSGSFIDRALKGIISRLKRVAGGDKQVEEQPA